MAWHPSQKEYEAVVRLDGEPRYRHFIKKVVDEEMLWGLWQDGWAMAGNDAGMQLMPVWPHPIYAEACVNNSWKKYQPRSITLSDWLNKWLPGMRKDGIGIAVFPIPSGKGVTLSLEVFEGDIRAELECYEKGFELPSGSDEVNPVAPDHNPEFIRRPLPSTLCR